VMAIGIYLPHSPFASSLSFTTLPASYWPLLALTLLGYMLLTQFVKQWLLRKRWL